MKDQYPTQSTEIISGRFASINFASLPELESSLRQPYQAFINESDLGNLPYPISSVSLESACENSNRPKILGVISFAPTSLEFNPDAWPDDFMNMVANELECRYTLKSLRHDANSLYVILDGEQAIRINFDATPTECVIEFETAHLADIKSATHENIAIDTADQRSNAKTLTKVGATMVTVMDRLYETFNTATQGRLYSFDARIPSDMQPSLTDRAAEPSSTIGRALVRLADTAPPPAEFLDSDTVTFSSLGGLRRQKERLMNIIHASTGDHLSNKYGLSANLISKHFILHGPAGTGKTTLVEAFANELGSSLLIVRSTDIIDRYIGESPKQLDAIFQDASEKTDEPVVIFFDEIDAFARKSFANKDVSAYNEVQNCLKRWLTDLAKYPHITVAAATNAALSELPPELTRAGRLTPIEVPLPNQNDLMDIWATILTHWYNKFDTEWRENAPLKPTFIPFKAVSSFDFPRLADMTDEKTGADIEAIIELALLTCCEHERRTGEEKIVDQQLLEEAARQYSLR